MLIKLTGSFAIAVVLTLNTPFIFNPSSLPNLGAAYAQESKSGQVAIFAERVIALDNVLKTFSKTHKLRDRELKRFVKTLKTTASVLGKISTYYGAKKVNDKKLESLIKQLERSFVKIERQLESGAVALAENTDLQMIVAQVQEIKRLQQTIKPKVVSKEMKGSKRELQAMSRVDAQLNKITKKIDRLKWEHIRDDRVILGLEKDLAKAKTAFIAISGSLPGHGKLAAKLDKTTVQVGEVRQRTENLLSKAASVMEELATYMRSGLLAEDNAFLQQATSLAYEQSRAADNGKLRFWNAGTDAQKYALWAATIGKTYQRAKEVQTRYSGASRRDLDDVARKLSAEIGDQAAQRGAIGAMLSERPEMQLQSIIQVHNMLNDLRVNGAKLVRDRMQSAMSAAKPLEVALDYDALTKDEGVSGAVTYAEDVLTVVAGFPDGNGHLSAIQKEYDAGKAEIDAIISRVYDLIVENNTPPRHRYKGKDSTRLLQLAEKGFAAFYKEQEIVGGVIESADWYRETKEEIQNGKLVRIDQSSVRAYIFAGEPGNRVSQWAVEITKNHRQDDALTTYLWQRTRPNPLPPRRVSLLKNLIVFE